MVVNTLTKPFSPIKFNQFFTLTGLYSAKGQYRGRTLE